MIDFESLKLVFPFIKELNPKDVFDFLKHTKLVHLHSGEIFLKEGSLKSDIYFIKKGLIRSYFINEKGEEITNRLRYENQVMSSLEVNVLKKASRFSFQAIEPTEMLVIDTQDLQKILDKNSKFESGRRFILMHYLSESLQALDDFILLNPEQRYLKFIAENPDLLNRVPIKYIANVLGITPVSLSRIRKRILKKKH